ncbi:MAG: hypothetical protein MH132_10175 [Hydrotalea sp.]|nr:hypothetical protein [Hydrotalea sp.]
MDYAVILQARMGSTRTPGKVGRKIIGKAMLNHQIQRLLKNEIVNIVVATSNNSNDLEVVQIAEDLGIEVFRGDENDVLKRYYETAKRYNINNIIRVCGDDPLIDPECIYSLINEHKANSVDYINASHRNGWIYGTTAELISFDCLKYAHKKAFSEIEREHVNPFIRNYRNFSKVLISPKDKRLIRPDIYLTVDFPEDFEVIRQIIEYFDKGNIAHTYSQYQLIELYDSGKISLINKHLHKGFLE